MKIFSFLLATLFLIVSCTNNGPSGPNADDFNREAILVNWADNIIIPAFTDLSKSTGQLHADATFFTETPTVQNLQALRDSWRNAYLTFQQVSMFETGKAMEVRFRDNLNIYPTDTTEIKENVRSASYNLELPSLNDSQGFPALDYLLNGLAENESEILSYYTTNTNAEEYKTYLTDLTFRIDSLTGKVLNNWTSSYRDEFVANSGNGANSSIDMMVNDYILYIEKYLRAGKIGIPAGVFSGSPLSSHVEGFYDAEISKALFMESLNAAQNFFNGRHYGSNETGESLAFYLTFLNTMKQGTDLTSLINAQFDTVNTQAQKLNANLVQQIRTDNSLMLSTYDRLQMNVVYLKVDMLQALNINVDYVDADGD